MRGALQHVARSEEAPPSAIDDRAKSIFALRESFSAQLALTRHEPLPPAPKGLTA